MNPGKKITSCSTPLENDPLLTPEETAARLRLTNANTLAVWRSKKTHPTLTWVPVGGRIFYRASTVERFITERETNKTNHCDQTWRARRKAAQ